MSTFLRLLEQGAAACAMHNARVLVAVSGGADSVALLHGLIAVRDALGLTLTAAHLDHRLRGDASTADARWLVELCERLGVPLHVGCDDVRQIAEQRQQGIEETARQVRYDFLKRTAEADVATHVAVAHTADDQAETILHHVLRGTGVAGLAGMPRVRPLTETVQLARPMLDVRRADVGAYLSEIGAEYRSDESNAELSFTRNRIRHSLLPLLRREYNPAVDEALRRLGRQAAEVQTAIEELAGRLLDEALLDARPSTCRLDCQRLRDQPRHLVRECFRLLWKRQQWPRQRIGFDDWQRLAESVTTGGSVTLPGPIQAHRRGQLLVLHAT